MINKKNIDPVLREKELDGYRSIAQRIRNRLQQLENASEKEKLRWIWELLQNAVDSANGKPVDIEVIIEENHLEFKHNGGVFTPRNVTNLVHQISSKEGTENIGRFGTGFLTTHTLSKIVNVDGVFIPTDNINEEQTEYSHFSLKLNRTGRNEEELVEGIANAWDTYQSDKLETIEKPFWTSFKYLEPNLDIAKNTINDFETYVCYSLAFVKEINSITIINKIENENISIKLTKQEKINELIEILYFEKARNTTIEKIKLFHIRNENISLAIEIKETNNKTFILPIKKNIPKLFCAYPLIGSEEFYFPFIINSIKFNPTQEREGLYLKGETTQSLPNKNLLIESVELYKTATNYITEQKWKDLFLIAKNDIPPNSDEFDTNWYINNIQKSIREHLLTIPVVEMEDGNYSYLYKEKSPKAVFPYATLPEIREKIWDFIYALFKNESPKKAHIHNWYNIIWDASFKLNLTILTSNISRWKNITKLAEQLKKDEKNTLIWLNDFVKFIDGNNTNLLDKYAILPNQDKNFRKKEELYGDDGKVPSQLKDILKDLGTDWYKEYLHKGISNKIMKNKFRRTNNLILLLNTIIDRNEFYMFEDYDYNKLIEKSVDKNLVDKLI